MVKKRLKGMLKLTPVELEICHTRNFWFLLDATNYNNQVLSVTAQKRLKLVKAIAKGNRPILNFLHNNDCCTEGLMIHMDTKTLPAYLRKASKSFGGINYTREHISDMLDGFYTGKGLDVLHAYCSWSRLEGRQFLVLADLLEGKFDLRAK